MDQSTVGDHDDDVASPTTLKDALNEALRVGSIATSNGDPIALGRLPMTSSATSLPLLSPMAMDLGKKLRSIHLGRYAPPSRVWEALSDDGRLSWVKSAIAIIGRQREIDAGHVQGWSLGQCYYFAYWALSLDATGWGDLAQDKRSEWEADATTFVNMVRAEGIIVEPQEGAPLPDVWETSVCPGQLAYESHLLFEHACDGSGLIPWGKLPMPEQEHWARAGMAVVAHLHSSDEVRGATMCTAYAGSTFAEMTWQAIGFKRQCVWIAKASHLARVMIRRGVTEPTAIKVEPVPDQGQPATNYCTQLTHNDRTMVTVFLVGLAVGAGLLVILNYISDWLAS